MDIFGIQEHDDQHIETERALRRIVEQVAQLSIDLGVTRMELRRLTLDVGKLAGETVQEADVDPAVIAMNESIKAARVRLLAAQEAANQEWAAKEAELSAALDDVRSQLNA